MIFWIKDLQIVEDANKMLLLPIFIVPSFGRDTSTGGELETEAWILKSGRDQDI